MFWKKMFVEDRIFLLYCICLTSSLFALVLPFLFIGIHYMSIIIKKGQYVLFQNAFEVISQNATY